MFDLMLFKTVQFFFEKFFHFSEKDWRFFFLKNIPAMPFQSIAIDFNLKISEETRYWSNDFKSNCFMLVEKTISKCLLKLFSDFLVHRIHCIGKCCLKNTLYEKSSFFVYDFVIIIFETREPKIQSVDSYI